MFLHYYNDYYYNDYLFMGRTAKLSARVPSFYLCGFASTNGIKINLSKFCFSFSSLLFTFLVRDDEFRFEKLNDLSEICCFFSTQVSYEWRVGKKIMFHRLLGAHGINNAFCPFSHVCWTIKICEFVQVVHPEKPASYGPSKNGWEQLKEKNFSVK